MGIVDIPRVGPMTGPKPEYAIAGSYADFLHFRRTLPRYVAYLTRERAEQLLAKGAAKGRLHRLPGWETSEARAAAEQLEG